MCESEGIGIIEKARIGLFRFFIKTRQNTPPLGAGMNGGLGSRGCNPLERGFQRGCKPLWSRAGLMPRLRSAPARSVEDAKVGLYPA